MNAYLIAARANAWEVEQHVGRAIAAHQPAHQVEALGRGIGCDAATRRHTVRSRRSLREMLHLA